MQARSFELRAFLCVELNAGIIISEWLSAIPAQTS